MISSQAPHSSSETFFLLMSLHRPHRMLCCAADAAGTGSDEAEPEPEGDDDWDASLARAPSRARSRPAHVLEGSDEADDSDDEDENNDEDDFDDDTDFKARKPALSKKNEEVRFGFK
jgi:hypothetical protein